MSEPDLSLPVASPPISSSTDAQPQETLLQRGAFDPPATPGTLGRLDRFEILRLLGEGGMGQVYLAREPRTDTRVAVKILRPQMAADPQAVHRFLTEARHMYRLAHPRILRVLEVSDRREGPYYVMPYVEGGSLRSQYRPGQPMPTEMAVTVARQVAEALAHAHAHGLIHRDLKPDNVLLDKDGNAYLTDFGLVRTVFNDSLVDASASHLEGTAPYMSPAVARGEAEDTRCDIYAFGALLYELLTGQIPYAGRTPQIILDQVIKGPPPPIREINPKANPALIKIAEGCLARELRDRYASMSDIVADLNRAAKGQVPFGPHRRQNRLPRVVAVAAGVAVIAGLAWAAVQFVPAIRASRPPVSGVGSPESPSPTPEPASEPADAPVVLWEGLFGYTVANGKATIVKYNGSGGDITIPDRIKEMPVTHIGDGAFADCGSLTDLRIPAGVTSIGWTAFSGCTALKSIDVAPENAYYRSEDGVLFNKWKTVLLRYPPGKAGDYAVPKGITKIDRAAFSGCGGLTAVSIPEGVGEIGLCTFHSCTRLTAVAIPGTVMRIGDSAFNRCDSLTDLRLDVGVTHIGQYAFAYCKNLTGIYFRGDAPALAEGAFLHAARATVYYRPGTKGWGKAFGGRPTAVWNGTVQNEFAFTTNNGAITITKYTGSGGDVTIPSTINGLPVTTIGDNAFDSCGSLTSVAIPVGVTDIVRNPFEGCSALAAITVHPSNPAFASVDGVVFNKEKTSILCYPACKPGSYEIPVGVTKIGWGAFIGASGLTKVTIPNNVIAIESYAFKFCSGLTDVLVPKSVTSIGAVAFGDCDRLSRFVIPDRVTCIDRQTFAQCGSLSSVTVPEIVTEIVWGAFQGCPSLASVYFKGDAPTLGKGVFDGSPRAVIYYRPGTTGWGPTFGGRPTAVWNGETEEPDDEQPAEASAISPTAKTQGPFVYTVTNGAVTIVKYDGPGGDVTIPRTINGLPITHIGNSAFRGCTSLTRITIPNTVTDIGHSAFYGCTGFDRVEIPDSVTKMSDWAFAATGLKQVRIPARVNNIGAAPFGHCGRLTDIDVDTENAFFSSVDGILFNKDGTCLLSYAGGRDSRYVVPETVKEIRYWAFAGCTNLPSVVISSSVTNIGRGAFSQCARLAEVTIPNRVNAIADRTFAGCSGLTSVMIPDSVVAIGEYAFGGCTGLTRVTIPAGVTSLGPKPFAACTGLTSIRVDDANLSYSSSADGVVFNKEKTCLVSCPAGKAGSYVIPASVTSIGYRAFKGCANLTRVTTPGSVIRIEGEAFCGCTRLAGVYFNGNAPRFASNAFNGTDNAIVYYRPGTKGWGPTFGGRPTAVWADGQEGPFSYVVQNGLASIVGYDGRGGEVTFPKVIAGLPVAAIEPVTIRTLAGLKGVTIPDGVIRIGDGAFRYCGVLVRVVIPGTVTNIGVDAFRYSGVLSNVCFEGDAPVLIGKGDNFTSATNATVYYRPGTKGWGPTFGGRPTAEWDGSVQATADKGGLYLVVDLSEGTNATRYPVTYLDAVPEGGWTDTYKTEKLVLRRIEPGTFVMGSPTNELSRDPGRETQHVVTLTKGFYVGVFEVSQRQWEQVMGKRPAYFNNASCYAARPVESVSCNMIRGIRSGVKWPESDEVDADSFMGRLRLRTGTEFDLPTDAQWEYACRAGTATGFSNGKDLTVIDAACPSMEGIGRYYYNSGAADNSCLRESDTGKGTAKVGSYSPNAWGLYDMHGNVYEWTADWWSPITNTAPVLDPKGPAKGGCKVVRGGSWNAGGTHCRSAVRPGSRNLNNASSTFGFRLASPLVTTMAGASAVDTPATPLSMIGTLPFTYTTNNGTITITKYTGPGGAIIIPSEINGVPVKTIKDEAFQNCSGVTSVVIPDSVTTIGSAAFRGCTGLCDVTIPASVTSIQWRPFAYCSGLTSIVVETANRVYCSENGVLFNKNKTYLAQFPGGKAGSYAIPNSVTQLGVASFDGCKKITGVTIPNSVTSLRNGTVFQNCSSLAAVTLPDHLTNIGPYEFWGCTRLAHITIPLSVNVIWHDAFGRCSNLTSITLPNGLSRLENGLFGGCARLNDVTIPNTVTHIGDRAFHMCESLTQVFFKGDAPSVGTEVFDGCKKATVFYLPGTQGWGKEFGGRPTAVWEQ